MERLPEEFKRRMKAMLGDEYEAFLASYEGPRRPGLRLNMLKNGAERLEKGSPFHLEPVLWASRGFYYDPETRPGRHPFHECGAYYIQEPSAMAVAALSGVKPGMRVLDLCAAPGGKSTHLASLMQGEGLLISNEIHPARAKILSQNMERMGVMNAVVINETPEKLKERFPLFFDAVVVDAPCSGEGMFRKEPEAIPNWSPENVELCAERQMGILDCAAEMTAAGGTLVYSTCTFAPLEDERNAALFLMRHPEFEIVDLPAALGAEFMEKTGLSAGVPEWAGDHPAGVDGKADLVNAGFAEAVRGCIRLWPHKLEGEGHFMAAFKRRGESFLRGIPMSAPSANKKGRNKKAGNKDSGNLESVRKEALKLWQGFGDEALTEPGKKKLAADGVEAGLTLFGSEVYRVPYSIDLTGLKVLRAGLHLGTVKKNRFEPSHSLALALDAEDVKCRAEAWADDGKKPTAFGSEPDHEPGRAAAAFLHGESLQTRECGQVTGEKGWCLVTIGGFSAGWGKLAGEQIKNHYPKGLRRKTV